MTQKEIVANMSNLADSGQDTFVENYKELAKQMLYEQGISNRYLESDKAAYILGKAVTDLIEDGNLSKTTVDFLKTLRVNHPHSEDVESNV